MIQTYIDNINKRFQTGISREHSYRGDLQNLLEALAPDVLVTNEPARIACGAPDYVITNKSNIPIGYIEAKDIGINLKSKTLREQFNRYKASLDNLIFTDYLDFHFYVDGQLVTTIAIGEIDGEAIIPKTENFEQFTSLMQNFCTHIGQTIKSSEKLSRMMAGKAKMLAKVIENALLSDEETQQNSTLREQMNAFKQILIHDIQPKGFADIYAQTIAYGMFAARLHDPTLHTFSRQEAAELIPKSNPFLRKLFQYIAGYDLDDRIRWIVDALADIFRATDVAALLQNFGKSTQMRDPIIHFYENFLAEYDPKLRKARGVWYTPEPVVNFIVRAVDEVLKTEFGLKKGLADTSKTKIKVNTQNPDKRSKTGYKQVEKEVHRVQILDPATGTGTFLAEIIKYIYAKYFKAMKGMWSSYVENDLIPRLNGFELLMASYAMAHLKLDLLLQETGYKSSGLDQRFRIFLTNSLEEAHPDTGTLFANWLSTEASEANQIKRDAPVMVVLGNPPYASSSSNKGEWILNLLDIYKKGLKEKTINSLSDDYVKFIRYGQYFIEKNGEGILAYISNNSFLDGITHRQMRHSLLKTFDKIYILDLHGDSKKKETDSDGSPDQNVFDIMQGVSINIFIKKTKKLTKGTVYNHDLYGKRAKKYKALENNSISSIKWKKLECLEPNYFFVEKDFSLQKEYDSFIHLSKLFQNFKSGIETKRDALFTDYDKNELGNRIKTLLSNDFDEEFRKVFNVKDSSGYNLMERILRYELNIDKIRKILYRPFDLINIYYDEKLIGRAMYSTMKHFTLGNNYGLVISKQCHRNFTFSFISNTIVDSNYLSSAKKLGGGYLFPLYLYEEKTDLFGETQRKPNLNPKIVAEIAKGLGLTFTPEKAQVSDTSKNDSFAPIDLLDYIYAVLHSPTYRETYKEFLKIDFPRVPYPTADTFWQLVKLGGELRQLHLLESEQVEEYITGYPKDGDNIITRKMTKRSIGYEATTETHGKVWINDEQYFEDVPLVAWEFYIGGYQPAQKWLKDRYGRELTFDDILHYQKIIVALTETNRLMQAIDQIVPSASAD